MLAGIFHPQTLYNLLRSIPLREEGYKLKPSGVSPYRTYMVEEVPLAIFTARIFKRSHQLARKESASFARMTGAPASFFHIEIGFSPRLHSLSDGYIWLDAMDGLFSAIHHNSNGRNGS